MNRLLALLELLIHLRQHIVRTRNLRIQRRQEEDADRQPGYQSSHDHNRERTPRIRPNAVRQCRGQQYQRRHVATSSDAIQRYRVPKAMHFAGSPIPAMANVHCAAATGNFMVLENHSVDVPWWSDLVNGVEKPIVNKGYITVPDKPGLGITLNDEVMKQHLIEPGYFEPTPQWDKESTRTNDRLFS